MEIELTSSEMDMARHIALERIAVTGPQRTNDQMGHLDKVPGNRQKADNLGVAGELAFAKAYNLWPDLDCSGPCTADVTLKDGRTVDVKTTEVLGGNLIANYKPHKTDLIALVEAKGRQFNVVGFIPTDILESDQYMTPMHGRVVYKFPRTDLIPL